MPATRPRELQFQFGLVDLVARDILTQARRAENGVRRAAAPGSYELLNCFVTVRRDSNEPPRCRCCCNAGGGVSRDRFRTSSTWPLDNSRDSDVPNIDREDCIVRRRRSSQ